MDGTYDILIIGGGPAGLSAAVAARGRGRSCLVISNPREDNPLSKAPLVDNYLGLPGLTGAEMMETFHSHARQMGAHFRSGRVLSAMDMGTSFFLTIGEEVAEGRKIILAPGIQRGVKYPGEEALLGRGVSYCASCDGMLYRQKEVIVVGRAKDAPHEANFLHGIGCKVSYVSPGKPEGLMAEIPWIKAGNLRVLGQDRVTGLLADGRELPCQGLFILRDTIAPNDLFPGLALEEGHIQVNRRMETNLAGVYAAGDCTGKPLQISKAVGEGLIAGQSAAEALEAEDKERK